MIQPPNQINQVDFPSFITNSLKAVREIKESIENRVHLFVAESGWIQEGMTQTSLSQSRSLAILTYFPAMEAINFFFIYQYLHANPQLLINDFTPEEVALQASLVTFITRIAYRKISEFPTFLRIAAFNFQLNYLTHPRTNELESEIEINKKFVVLLQRQAAIKGGIKDIQRIFPLPEERLKDLLKQERLDAKKDILPLFNKWTRLKKDQQQWLLKFLDAAMKKDEQGQYLIDKEKIKCREDGVYYFLSRVLVCTILIEYSKDEFNLFFNYVPAAFSKLKNKLTSLSGEERQELRLHLVEKQISTSRPITDLAHSIKLIAEKDHCLAYAGTGIEAWHDNQTSILRSFLGWDE